MLTPCPRCGRETSVLVRGLCPDCFAEVYGLAVLPRRVTVEVCKYCGSVRLGNRWIQASSFQDAVYMIARHVLSRAKPVDPLERVELVSVEYDTLPNWLTKVRLQLRASYRGSVITGWQSLEVRLKPTVCPTCKIRVSGEYDTLVQVRGGDPGEVERIIEEEVVRQGLLSHFVDLIRGRDGVDVYFTHRGAARKLAKALARYYEASIKTPAHEDVGVGSTGKRRTRKTIVVRLGKRLNKI